MEKRDVENLNNLAKEIESRAKTLVDAVMKTKMEDIAQHGHLVTRAWSLLNNIQQFQEDLKLFTEK